MSYETGGIQVRFRERHTYEKEKDACFVLLQVMCGARITGASTLQSYLLISPYFPSFNFHVDKLYSVTQKSNQRHVSVSHNCNNACSLTFPRFLYYV